MKAYKGFDKNLSCYGGFKYEIGKTYEMKGDLKLCKNGFHACLFPLDCFMYYPPFSSRYCIVEVHGDDFLKSDEDSKICCRKMTIIEEMTFDELYLEAIGNIKWENRWTAEGTPKENEYIYTYNGQSVAGDSSISHSIINGMAVSGQWSMSKAGSSGVAIANRGSVSMSYDNGVSFVTSGKAIAGVYGVAIGKTINSAAETGNDGWSVAYNEAVSGDNGISIARFKASTGKNGVAVVLSAMSSARGGMGAMLVFKKINKSIVIDGNEYLEDIWYTLDCNGNIIHER